MGIRHKHGLKLGWRHIDSPLQHSVKVCGKRLSYAACTLTAVYNDTESVRRLMEENAGQVAAVVVEPVAANMGVAPKLSPPPQALCTASTTFGCACPRMPGPQEQT